VIASNTDSSEKGYIVFHTANPSLAERMRITADGKVGIGTTSPSYTLHVNGEIYGTKVWGAVFNDY